MSTKLRDFIRSIRGCKTAAEERSIVQKEKAAIRNSFTEDESQYRARNVAKLLFMNMMNYDTDFGQMECLKLITSSSYLDKRIGYLGLTQLFNEQSEILMMSTHRIRLDLCNDNPFITSIALTAMAEICTPDMCRELAPEIAKLIASGNSYIKKKAALAATRIIRKIPDLVEEFVDKVDFLVEDKHHGVMISGLGLIEDIVAVRPKYRERMLKYIAPMLKQLKNIVTSYSAEYDINGIPDPFLQIQIIKFFRGLLENDEAIHEDVVDILAQISTNTSSAKNTGNAVLYECVRTIMSIKSAHSLKTLGINILGKFLTNKDSNSKYVGLLSLQNVIHHDMNAVQKHKNTILDCLKENDNSVRKQALDLLHLIANENNITSIVKEMLNYLLLMDQNLLSELTLKICLIVEKYAPDRRWHIDTIIKVLTLAGNNVKEESISSLIQIIAATPELHMYTVNKIYFSLVENLSQEGLARAGLWCIGEYGELLINGQAVGLDNKPIQLTQQDVLGTIENILTQQITTENTKLYGLNCLIKLYTKYSQPTSRDQIRILFERFSTHPHIEVQQRACEYINLIDVNWGKTLNAILEKLPALQRSQVSAKAVGQIEIEERLPQENRSQVRETSIPNQPQNTNNEIFDLDMLLEPTPQATTSNQPVQSNNQVDTLMDIFSTPVNSQPTPVSQPPQPQSNNLNIFDLYGTSYGATTTNPVPTYNNSMGTGFDLLSGYNNTTQPIINQPYPVQPINYNTQPIFQPTDITNKNIINTSAPISNVLTPSVPQQLTIKAYDDGQLEIIFNCSKKGADTTVVQTNFNNKTSALIQNLTFQAAVLKHLKLTMSTPSSNKIPPNTYDQVTQSMKVVNSLQGQKGIVMKLKIAYQINDRQVKQEVTISEFPLNY